LEFFHQLYPSETQGITRSVPDMQIASTAIAHEPVLATRNERDFMGCGVQVVNPFDGF
jgi:predicted nucleic acid-binding protein